MNDLLITYACFQVVVEAGLYHGGRALCETRTTQEVSISSGTGILEENLTFSIAVCNIPRNARLCLAIYEVSRSSKTTKARSSIGSRQVCTSALYFYSIKVFCKCQLIFFVLKSPNAGHPSNTVSCRPRLLLKKVRQVLGVSAMDLCK